MVLVTKSIVPKLENGRNVSTPNQVQSLKRKCIEKICYIIQVEARCMKFYTNSILYLRNEVNIFKRKHAANFDK